MNTTHTVIVALVALALNGVFLGLAFVYRQRLKQSQHCTEELREELAASRKWNAELRDANTAVQHLVTRDPMQLADQLPQRSDPLEQLYLLQAVIPEHERGQQ